MAYLVKLRKLDQLIQDEITCPVCMQEFENPKCLPCLHSVCKKCLENLTRGNAAEVVQCPVDKRRSFLPDKGIESLPSNVFLLQMLENRPGRHNRTEMRTALEKCRQKVWKIRQVVENKVNEALEKEKQNVKKQIHTLAETLRREITEKEEELCSQADNMVAKEMENFTGTSTDQLLDQTESLFEDVENMLGKLQTREIRCDTTRKSFIEYLLGLDESNVISSLKRKPSSAFIPFVFDFNQDKRVVESLKQLKLGHIDIHTGMLSSSDTTRPQTLCPPHNPSRTHIAGEILKTLEVPEEFKSTFNPSAIAVSRMGQIALTDTANEQVLIYNEHQEYSSTNISKTSNDFKEKIDLPTAAAFTLNNNIIVLNSCAYGKQQLQVLDCDGQAVKCLVQVNCLEETQLRNISVDISGRIIASCHHPACHKPFIQVYSSEGVPELTLHPPLGFDDDMEKERARHYCRLEKVIYTRGKFVVSYSDFTRNRCGVKILDHNGNCVSILEENKLIEGDKLYPVRIAVDQLMGSALCYHGLSGLVSVYDLSGRHKGTFKTVPGIMDMALTTEGTLVVVCSHEGHEGLAKACLVAYR